MYEIIKKRGDLWDLFTRKEEYNPIKLDRHDKFTYNLASQRDIMDPVVSTYLVNSGFKMNYPDDKKFAVCLTHDVDDIYPPLSHSILSSLYCVKDLDFARAKKHLFWRKFGKECSPYRNFKQIIELEEQYDARSSFYFIATPRDIRRFRYNISDIEHDLGYIRDKGWEVGLHGGYYSYNNYNNIKNEKESLELLLGKKIVGYRNHYLRFKVPDSWELLARAGFKYDTTLGYDHMIGFRNGMCHPFRPYNLNTDQPIDILEIPLSIMDVTFLEMKSGIKQSFNLIKKMMDITEKNQGVLTLLWHNNIFSCPFRDSLHTLYKNTLKLAYKRNAWMASGEDILRAYQ